MKRSYPVHKASRALVTFALTSLATGALAPPALAAATDVAATDTDANDSRPDTGAVVETVIVTANRRAENLQTVPTSISAVTAEQIKDLGITSTTGIANYVPGVQLMSVNSNTDNFFSIRGATQNDYAEHEESPVAVYMDGVYLSQAGGTSALLFDTARVEVLRGPQGTLFGRNATAGLVQYISVAPTDHPDGYFETSYGNFNANHTEAAFGDGIAPGLSFRASFANDYMDPYMTNALYPDKGGGNSNTRAGRVQLEYAVDNDFDVTLNVHGVILNDRDGLYKFLNVYADPNNHDLSTFVASNQNPWGTCNGCDILGYKVPSGYNYYTSAADIVGWNKESTYGTTVTIHGMFEGGLTLTSISDFTRYLKSYNEDSDGTPQDLLQYWSTVDTKQYSQELHLQNSSTVRARWTVGVYALKMDGHYLEGNGQGAEYFSFIPVNLTPGDAQRYEILTKSWSEFAQLEYDIVPKMTLTAGGRWSTEEKTFNYQMDYLSSGFIDSPAANVAPLLINSSVSGDAARIHRSDWSGKLALNYRLTDAVIPYVSWNKGIKAGGFSAAGNASLPLSDFKFDEEKLYSYEVGVKSEAFNHKVRFNADVFDYRYVGYQAFNTVDTHYYITNNPGKMRGGEAELTVVPMKGLTVRAGLALLDAWIESLTLPDGTTANTRPTQAPKTNITTSVSYGWDVPWGGSMLVGTDASYRSSLYYSLLNDPASMQSGYGLLNARAEYTTADGHWSFKLHGENILNKHYLNNAIVSGSIGFGQGSPGMPATYGIRFSYHYGAQ